MAIVIDWFGIEATIEDGEWKCDDADLLERLEIHQEFRPAGGSVPYADLYYAMEAVHEFGARIISQDPSKDKGKAGRIY